VGGLLHWARGLLGCFRVEERLRNALHSELLSMLRFVVRLVLADMDRCQFEILRSLALLSVLPGTHRLHGADCFWVIEQKRGFSSHDDITVVLELSRLHETFGA